LDDGIESVEGSAPNAGAGAGSTDNIPSNATGDPGDRYVPMPGCSTDRYNSLSVEHRGSAATNSRKLW